jgi:RNA polymerase sigma-70 factor (ECF subfamily)
MAVSKTALHEKARAGEFEVAVFANNPIYRVQWSLSQALALLRDWRRRLVHFAERLNDSARAKGVPTDDLIQRFQRGQPLAFEALYDRFKDYVYRTAFFVTRNSGDAEEAVQETFLDVLRALPNYRVDGPARFETWLYRVTVNRCRSRLRRKTLPSADWDDVEERLERIPGTHPDHDPEGVTLRHERAATLWQQVDGLSDAHRVVVLLRYQQGLSYSEIAQTLGIGEGTVKSRLYNAHRKLKERLQTAEGGLERQKVVGVA